MLALEECGPACAGRPAQRQSPALTPGQRRRVRRRSWRNYIQPRFGNWPVASITAAEVSGWVGALVAGGELAGLQVGDRVRLPGPGLRLRRAVLASGGGGSLYVDTLKNNQARTVPLVMDLVPIVDRWSVGKASDAWLFEAPGGGPLRESNWKRSVGWSGATGALGLAGFRVH
jgi:hypothetical protein